MVGVSLLKIPVSDLSSAVSFYRATLGLEPAFVAEQYGWAQLEGASVPVALYVPGKGGGSRQPGGSLDFHLSCNNLDGLHHRVSQANDSAKIHKNDDGSRSLEFEDSDGNIIKVMERV